MVARTIHSRGYSIAILLLIPILLAGCFGGTPPQPSGGTPGVDVTIDPALYTESAATIVAELTLNAPSTAESQGLPSSTPTEEPLPATSTPLPTNTPLPSDTPLPTNTPLPTDTPTPIGTPSPTIPPTPTEPAWQLYYTDDFTSSRFWAEESSDLLQMEYTAGGYSISSQVVGDIIYSTRTGQLTGVRVETKAQHISGPLDAYYGVICNFVNGGNYYLLAVGADRWYGIVKKQAMQTVFLAEGVDTSGALQAGGNSVNIRGDCYNGELTLWANGTRLASVRDVSFTTGSVGLGVGTHNTTGVEVVFDDFNIYTAPSQAPAAVTPEAGTPVVSVTATAVP